MKKEFKDFKDFIKNKKVAVVGVGVSNTPLIKFLINLGATVTGFDAKSRSELGSIIDDFENEGVMFELGEHYLDNLHGYDVIFKTPSMRIDAPCFERAKEEGAYITSEMEEFIRYTKGKIIAVTGSDGKTTTTSIIAKLLKEEGYNTWVGGNIGTPLFSKIENIKEKDMVVLELSSFQLMTINLPIDVAVVTNITPNHLDMHKDMNEYIDAKKNLFLNQKSDGVLVINDDNETTSSFNNIAKGLVRKFSSKKVILDGAYIENGLVFLDNKKVCCIEDMMIKGIHNAENFLAAFLATKDFISIETMIKIFKTFPGVEHRCEFVREFKGVSFYNDSIASSPTRTIAGLKAFNKKVIVLAGGYDKKIPFDILAKEGGKYIKDAILFGATKYKIKEAFDKYNKNVSCVLVDTMEDAIELSLKKAVEGDVITLSPACASFDMYPNFMVRGEKYKEYINNLK